MVNGFSILILTEDSGERSFDTLKALIEKMLFLVDAAHVPTRVKYLPATSAARAGMRFNCWKSQNPRDHGKRVDLARAIATALSREDHVVIVHVDGDRPYSQSDYGNNADNLHDFRKLVETVVIQHLGSARKLIERMVIVVPFYSIEAWLYQNFDEIQRICKESPNSRTTHDLELISSWQQDRTLLDEVHAPKETLSLKDKYNHRLATARFPAKATYDVGKSYANAINALRGCQHLIELLLRIRRPGA